MKRRYASQPLCSVLTAVATGDRGIETSPHVLRELRLMRLMAPTKIRLNQRGKALLRRCR